MITVFMIFLTWNINKKPVLLNRALNYLAQNAPAVGVFQELPLHIDTAWLAAQGYPVGLQVQHVLESKTYRRNIAIVSSGSLQGADPREDSEKKLFAVSVVIPNIGLTDVVAVHAISHASEDNVRKRGKRAGSLRRAFNDVQRNEHALMIGDFNADPFDEEVWDNDRLFAIRDREVVRHACSRIPVRGSQPLWNPCWSLIGECTSMTYSGGSFYYPKELKHSHWFLFDQVFLTHSLIPFFKEVRVLDDIGGPLTIPFQPGPRMVQIGDHLPLSLSLDTGVSNAVTR